MTTVDILLNNYNYAAYLGEAIESVLAQSLTDWRLIIVDDGSNDDSLQIAQRYASRDARIVAINKPNGGQLSAFNVGYSASQAPFIFFLDADDRFHPDYLQQALSIYQNHNECDFLSVAQHLFGAINQDHIREGLTAPLTDLGFSAYITAHQFLFLGEGTSAVSMRRSLARKIFPIANEPDWRIQADNCLVYMASIMGGRKYYCSKPLIEYRTHESNGWFQKTKSKHETYVFDLSVERFFARIRNEHPFLYQHRDGNYALAKTLLREAATGTKPAWLIDHYLTALDRLSVGFFKTFKLRQRFKRLLNQAQAGMAQTA